MLRLITFGGLGLTNDGTPLTSVAAQRSRLSLLALLATAGEAGMSRDKLLLLLWPESDGERARHALKQSVYALRKELGSDEVIVGTAALSLNASLVTSDVRDFEIAIASGNFAAAACVYAGPFLDGVHIKDSAEFDRWSDELRSRYHHRWTTALAALATECEQRAAWQDAAGHWRTLAASEPLSGRLTQSLMRCLAEGGDVAAAVRQYRIHETLLRDELGTAPETALIELNEALRNGTWTRSPARIATPPASTTAVVADASTAAIASTTDATLGSDNANVVVPVEATIRRRGRRPSPAFLVLGIIALVIVAVAVPYALLDPQSKAVFNTVRNRPPATLEPKQIVVAPFENKTGDASLDALGEQIADWFARELSEAGFKVVDARTARIGTKVVEGIPVPFRARDRNIALGEETGSAYAVVGNYYRQGDTLIEANVSIVDVATKQTRKSLGPYHGSRGNADAFIVGMLKPTVGYLASDVDSSAGALTLKYSSPPSLEAFTRVSRAWERFFAVPADTTPVFAELDSAAAIDPSYATPLLMKAYMLDVKSNWKDAETVMKRVRPLAAGMSRLDRAALELVESDLLGNALARPAIAARLRDLSPASGEMPLLLVVSSLYIGRTDDALHALALADPNRGLNLVSPTYFDWSSLALHSASKLEEEAAVVDQAIKRFKYHPASTHALVRVLAARNDPALAATVARGLQRSGNNVSNGGSSVLEHDSSSDRQELMLFAGEELRAHGHIAAADSMFLRLRDELALLPANASSRKRRLQAHAFYEAGDFARAKAAFSALLHDDPTDIEAKGRVGTSAAHLGDSTTAARIDRDLATLNRPFLMGEALRWRANIAAVMARPVDAAALLEQAIRQGHRFIDLPTHMTVHLDRDWVEARKHPAFAAMLRTLSEPVRP